MAEIANLEAESIALLEEYTSKTAVILNEAYDWFHEAIAIILVVLALNFLLNWILKYFIQKFDSHHSVWKKGFVEALGLPLASFIWIFASVKAFDRVTEHIFKESWIPDVTATLAIVGVICFTWFLLRWKKFARKNLMLSGTNHFMFQKNKVDVIDKLATVVILFFSILFILELADRSLTTLIAFGGVGGLAIAFASQEVISNFFGGLMIYMNHPFSVGDWIVIPDKNIEGHVEEIGWYMTRVRTFEKRPIYIPNAIFNKSVVVNPTRMSHRRIKETVGLRYEDMKKAKSIAADIYKYLSLNPNIDQNEKNQVNVDNFGDFSVDINVVAFTLDTDGQKYADIKQDVLLNIADIVAKHGADFASPPYFEPSKG